MNKDTIAAIATPPGRGGVGIVRVSGPLAGDIAQAVLGRLPAPRQALFGTFRYAGGEALDQGLALYFPAPASFTGEDVLELHGHGGVVVMDELLARTLESGARLARPGEFSERAFLNGKMDLLQAEAVADLIDSASRQAAHSAMRSLDGSFSKQINQLAEKLQHLRVYVEAGIDFPDEELDLLADGQVEAQIQTLQNLLGGLFDSARQGHILREGMRLVIIGEPNVGKSSLLNRLAQRDAAIVTDIPGTTRDLVHEQIHLDGMPLHISDTAGLRETDDLVEQEGIRRTREALAKADMLLLVLDDRHAHPAAALQALSAHVELPGKAHILVLCNKCDLSGHDAGFSAGGELRLSAKSGAGMDLLKQRLKQVMHYQDGDSGTFMARRRHLDALRRCREHVVSALHTAQQRQSELCAEELRLAQQCLGEITGQISSEDLLGDIFAGFCIGK